MTGDEQWPADDDGDATMQTPTPTPPPTTDSQATADRTNATSQEPRRNPTSKPAFPTHASALPPKQASQRAARHHVVLRLRRFPGVSRPTHNRVVGGRRHGRHQIRQGRQDSDAVGRQQPARQNTRTSQRGTVKAPRRHADVWARSTCMSSRTHAGTTRTATRRARATQETPAASSRRRRPYSTQSQPTTRSPGCCTKTCRASPSTRASSDYSSRSKNHAEASRHRGASSTSGDWARQHAASESW